jgi:hypothetical protein
MDCLARSEDDPHISWNFFQDYSTSVLCLRICVITSISLVADIFPENVPPTDQSHADEFNTDFSSWLPRYQKPSHPCDYCRSRSLECFVYSTEGPGQAGCSPCSALFRPCSFSNPERMPAQKQRTALDTLDVVAEDDVRQWGGFTGRKQLRSLGHMGPIDDEDQGEHRPKKGAAAARFPRAAVKVLKDWMLAHIDHPYPTDEEKEILGRETDLSVGQISNWMANTRRRQKAKPKRSSSPSIRPSTEAINIPPGRTWESLSMYPILKPRPSHTHTDCIATGSQTSACMQDSHLSNRLYTPILQQQNCLG